METGFLLSYGAFVAEVIVFVIAVFQAPWKSASDEKGTRIRIALVLAVLGLVALTSPVSFIVSYPDSLKTAHPFSWALLICAPAMPIVFLVFRHRH
jgi:heme A synthase